MMWVRRYTQRLDRSCDDAVDHQTLEETFAKAKIIPTTMAIISWMKEKGEKGIGKRNDYRVNRKAKPFPGANQRDPF